MNELNDKKDKELEAFNHEVDALAMKFYEVGMNEKASRKVALTAAMQLIYACLKGMSAKERAAISSVIKQFLAE